jgi:hypothetical protein
LKTCEVVCETLTAVRWSFIPWIWTAEGVRGYAGVVQLFSATMAAAGKELE